MCDISLHHAGLVGCEERGEGWKGRWELIIFPTVAIIIVLAFSALTSCQMNMVVFFQGHIDPPEAGEACNSSSASTDGEMLAVTRFRMSFELPVWGGASLGSLQAEPHW